MALEKSTQISKTILDLSKKGYLIAVASKNNFQDVNHVFENIK